jgi:hypothetical protein
MAKGWTRNDPKLAPSLLLVLAATCASAVHAPPPSQGLRDHPIASSGPPAVSAIHSPPPSQGLRDHPITSSGPPAVYLDTAWVASSATANLSLPAVVPGDLLTDLQRAKVITDPWLDITWMQNSSLWTEHAWTYTTHFDVPDSSFARTSALRLIFDGVKMGATVRVNGHKIGELADQFLRYTFTLDSEVLDLLPASVSAGAGANRLDVTFGLEDVAEDGRFMACTGGWDWAPFSYTTTNSSGKTTGPANTLSKGLWKSVYVSLCMSKLVCVCVCACVCVCV